MAADSLTEQVVAVRERFAAVERQIADPSLSGTDPDRYFSLCREHSRLEPIVHKAAEREQLLGDLAAARSLLEDRATGEAPAAWVHDEIRSLTEAIAGLDADLHALLLPRDPRDDRDVILEIRAGAGGDEAALFAADLARMYARYAERKGWKVERIDSSETGIGGLKEIVFSIQGAGAYSRLKYESGVHRVQRVPETEANGRLHTSTATVAVLPEAEEVEVEIRPDDVEIDTYRSSGAGGQHVNKTESAIRLTHRPSGIVVTCQDERSQMKNRAKAFAVLRARLLALRQGEQSEQISAERRAQVGAGERSERIRTYNFRENRVSEERINLTLYRLRTVLEGDMDDIIEALAANDVERKLREGAVVARS